MFDGAQTAAHPATTLTGAATGSYDVCIQGRPPCHAPHNHQRNPSMIPRSTLEAAKRVAEYAACRPIVLKLSALSTPPAVEEPNSHVRIERAAARRGVFS